MTKPLQLYSRNGHECFMFHDLVDEDTDAVQSNQFFIRHGDKIAVIEPGGQMTFNAIYMQRMAHFPNAQVEYIIASHADPDVISSLGRWMAQPTYRFVIPSLWSRFVPHFCTKNSIQGRIIPVPDSGGFLPFGSSFIIVLPAHFMHAEGNFQFYDPISKILFSGDLGASLITSQQSGVAVADFDRHLPLMRGFHRRYMSSRKVCQYWANMVRQLDIEMIVPQHGLHFVGREMVNRFVSWVEDQDCGVDLMTQTHYSLPTSKLKVAPPPQADNDV